MIQCVFFQCAHGIFIEMNPMLDLKASLKNFMIEIPDYIYIGI